MNRLWLVAAIAIAIFWNSDCLTFKDGRFVNRCGIWQFVTKSSLVLLVESKPVPDTNKALQQIITSTSNPIPSGSSGVATICSAQTGNNTNCFSTSNATANVIHLSPIMGISSATISSSPMYSTMTAATLSYCSWNSNNTVCSTR